MSTRILAPVCTAAQALTPAYVSDKRFRLNRMHPTTNVAHDPGPDISGA